MCYIFLKAPQEVRDAYAILMPDLGLKVSEEKQGAFRVEVSLDAGQKKLRIRPVDEGVEVLCASLIQACRALSFLPDMVRDGACAVEEEPRFSNCGTMLDASRNAVPKPGFVRYLLRRMALMGMNVAMLYTEDTYEVPEIPYFGYMRGAYPASALREMDDYAHVLGIELVPCIQTFGHLDRMLHWPQMMKYSDVPAVLLAEDEEVYALLDHMIRSASEPFRTKRIHIGMDEAFGLGTGRYRRFHPDTPPYQIMLRHLNRVRDILKKYDLKPMMWSDMYFRLASPTHDYYDMNHEVSPEIVDLAPKDVDLVYWDYYNEDEDFYDLYFRQHSRFGARTIFAGGCWTWAGPAANYGKAIAASLPALKKCVENKVDEVLLTAWGDVGAECNLIGALYGMQLYAEYCYTGEHDKRKLHKRFFDCTGADAEIFLRQKDFSEFPGMKHWRLEPGNAIRTLLYQDPLLPLMEKDYEGIDVAAHYKELDGFYSSLEKGPEEMEAFYDFYRKLARLMALKSAFHRDAAGAVRAKDREAARRLADSTKDVIAALYAYKDASRTLWMQTNEPFGFEVIDLRLGGLIARFESARLRLSDLAEGRIEDIPELSCEKLPFYKNEQGEMTCCFRWMDCASAGRIM